MRVSSLAVYSLDDDGEGKILSSYLPFSAIATTTTTPTMSLRGVAPPPAQLPFQLLEINIISAQELAPVTRNVRSYAIGWVHPQRKLSTRIDTQNHVNPTWNDKFVFRVDEDFLSGDTSAVMVKIYAVRCFRDILVGTVRVLVGNLLPSYATRSHQQQTGNSGMRFVALQVRRPSGRPQGILNIGVALLDGSMRSMPLYNHLNNLSAVGYRDLMGEEPNSPTKHHNLYFYNNNKNKFDLRRTRSERTSNFTDNDFPRKSGINGSDYGEPPLATITAGSSIWSESDVGPAPSMVAAAVAEELFPMKNNNNNNNILLEGRDLDEDKGIEQLKSKLERWKTELPPIYDRGGGSYGGAPGYGSKREGHARRHTDGGGGLLSCFGDGYGCEVSISCGLKPTRKSMNRKGKSNMTISDDDDEISQPYIIA